MKIRRDVIEALEKRSSEWVDTLDAGELVYVVGVLLVNIHALTATPAPEARATARVCASIAEKATRRLVESLHLVVVDTIHEPLREFLDKLGDDFNAAVTP